MQDPFGRLPAPDSYAGSTAPSITGFGGHPTRFSRFRASPRDTDDSYDARAGEMMRATLAEVLAVTQSLTPAGSSLPAQSGGGIRRNIHSVEIALGGVLAFSLCIAAC